MSTSFSALIEQPSFQRMVRPVDQAAVCLPREEIAAHAGHEGMVKTDDNSRWSAKDFKWAAQVSPNLGIRYDIY